MSTTLGDCHISDFAKRYNLSKLQSEILHCLFKGDTRINDIAEKIGKSKSNISTSLNRIYDKIGVSGKTELMLNLTDIYFDS